MEKNEFELLILAISGLRTELKSELNTKFGSLDKKIDGISGEIKVMRNDIRVIREQTGQTVVDVADLKVRVAKLEGPSA